MGDHRLALFLEQPYELFLLGHQSVDLAGFVVEEGGDGALFGLLWDHQMKVADLCLIERRDCARVGN